jgi:hypothetical protein
MFIDNSKQLLSSLYQIQQKASALEINIATGSQPTSSLQGVKYAANLEKNISYYQNEHKRALAELSAAQSVAPTTKEVWTIGSEWEVDPNRLDDSMLYLQEMKDFLVQLKASGGGDRVADATTFTNLMDRYEAETTARGEFEAGVMHWLKADPYTYIYDNYKSDYDRVLARMDEAMAILQESVNNPPTPSADNEYERLQAMEDALYGLYSQLYYHAYYSSDPYDPETESREFVKNLSTYEKILGEGSPYSVKSELGSVAPIDYFDGNRDNMDFSMLEGSVSDYRAQANSYFANNAQPEVIPTAEVYVHTQSASDLMGEIVSLFESAKANGNADPTGNEEKLKSLYDKYDGVAYQAKAYEAMLEFSIPSNDRFFTRGTWEEDYDDAYATLMEKQGVIEAQLDLFKTELTIETIPAPSTSHLEIWVDYVEKMEAINQDEMERITDSAQAKNVSELTKLQLLEENILNLLSKEQNRNSLYASLLSF